MNQMQEKHKYLQNENEHISKNTAQKNGELQQLLKGGQAGGLAPLPRQERWVCRWERGGRQGRVGAPQVRWQHLPHSQRRVAGTPS